MIINQIKLKNFKSHKNTTINLEQGITVIIGSNGAGKSSILEAISYALFKKFNGKLENLIRNPEHADDIINEMEITITFTHETKKYKITRGRKGNTSHAKLYKINNEEKPILESQTDKIVTNDIQKILNIDPDSFLNAVYIKQGEITDLIDKTASERKELISKLLNIDSLEKAWEQIKDIIKTYENKKLEIQLKEENLKKQKETLQKEQQKETQLQKTITNIENKINQIQETLTKQEQNKKSQKLKKQEHEHITQEIKTLTKTKETLTKQEQTLQKEINQINQNQEIIKQLETEIKDLPILKEIKQLNEEKEKITKEEKSINQNITKINKYITIKEETKETYNKNQENTNKIKELKQEEQKLQKNKEEYIEQKTRKETLRKQKDNLTQSINNSIKKAQTKLNTTEKQPPILIKQLGKTKHENIINKEDLETQKQEKIQLIKLTEEEIKRNNKTIKELKNTDNQCPVCQSQITPEKKEELLTQSQTNITKYNSNITKLTKEIQKLKEQINKLEETNEELDSINEKILEKEYNELLKIIPQLSGKDKNYELLKEKVKKLENTTLQINKIEQEKETTKKEIEKYTQAINILKELPNKEEEKEKQKQIQKQLKDIQDKLIRKTQQIQIPKNLNQEITNLEKKSEKYHILNGTIINKEEKLNQIKNIQNQIQQETKNITNKETQLQQTSFNIETYNETEKIYKTTQEQLNKTKQEQSQIIGQKNQLTKQIQQLIQETEKITQIQKELKNTEDYIKLLTKIRELYSKDGIQKTLRNNARPTIEEKTRKIFNEFNFNYTNIQLDEDYNIQVQGPREFIDLSMLSGGEKIAIALALRLGITNTISNSNFEMLILDEPTIHLDQQRCTELVKIIKKMNATPQMIVVTHDPELEEISSNIIKIDKNNSISKLEEE